MDNDGAGHREARWQAYDVYARLYQLRWRLPSGHPAVPHVQRAAAEAEAYWRRLSTSAGAPAQPDDRRAEAAS